MCHAAHQHMHLTTAQDKIAKEKGGGLCADSTMIAFAKTPYDLCMCCNDMICSRICTVMSCLCNVGLLDVVWDVLLAQVAHKLQALPGHALLLLALHHASHISPPLGSRTPLLGSGLGSEMSIGGTRSIG